MQAGSQPDGENSGVSPAVRLLVTLATYNERDNLRALSEEILSKVPFAQLLVIDDNSPDGTGKLADELKAADPRIDVIHRSGKLGLGTAMLAACKYAFENEFDFLLNLDADFSHPPRFIPAILEGMKRNDVMIGSRYTPGGGTENWPLSRKIISRSVNLLVRILFGMGVRDASGAFRCYRVSKLRQAKLERIWSRGYSFQQEVLYRCFRAGSKLGETPIIFENRRAGVSKVNLREAVRSLSMLVFLGIRYRLGLDHVAKLSLPVLSH
ncbi:polyprenol monophosphomannose synthase [Telmatocola sphagniphila]|uniref:Polyprenol monophosphomannose synthase n=1 Tax=Telmatocola sphagniphila TaxID=1123043 RepID=A0A8E6B9A8_9BACT|nr:polyprenol monophosphomannose synthase [Telmatocola sphagniphila]QVL32750.1 polyprenol monophosphomannose synthase [Telmatocola sphagniphila]